MSKADFDYRQAVARAGKALEPYMHGGLRDGDGPEDAPADLLADLMVFCEERGIDFETVSGRAGTYHLMTVMGVRER